MSLKRIHATREWIKSQSLHSLPDIIIVKKIKENVMAGHVAGVEKPENLKRRKHLRNMDRDVRMTFKLILINYNVKY